MGSSLLFRLNEYKQVEKFIGDIFRDMTFDEDERDAVFSTSEGCP